jgi:hypothetical protein
MTDSDIKEIKEKLDAIITFLGIGKLKPINVIDIREKAKQKAVKLGNQANRRE